MRDFYSQRLQDKVAKKQARINPQMPLQRPNSRGAANPMASNPQQPQQEQEAPKGMFKSRFDEYADREGGDFFKADMEQFTALVETMRKELDGMGVPEKVQQRRMEQLVDKFVTASQQRRGQTPQIDTKGGAAMEGLFNE